MNEQQYNTDEKIAALATPWAESALAVIRTSGTDSIAALSKVFSRPRALVEAPGQTAVYGFLLEPGSIHPVDEVMVTVYRAPKSYTGEESAEIACHGSLPGIEAILELLKTAGFRSAAPGEFTYRAFLNRKMDLTRAEAVQEIVGAKSRRAHSLAMNRLSGGVTRRIASMKAELLRLMALVQIQLDYSDDEIQEPLEIPAGEIGALRSQIDQLAATYAAGRIYRDGARVVLAGKTNSGKSSLFNLFLKEDRSIVSNIHGTTRDYIESWVSLDGIPVRLFDTAGLRRSDDPVEMEGIRRSRTVMDKADLVLQVFDGTAPAQPEVPEGPVPVINIWNKADMEAEPCPEGYILLSAVDGTGFDLLEEAVKKALGVPRETEDVALIIDSQRQRDLLLRASESLGFVDQALAAVESLDGLAMDLKDALDALGEITGEVTTADILDAMFSGFCVGK